MPSDFDKTRYELEALSLECKGCVESLIRTAQQVTPYLRKERLNVFALRRGLWDTITTNFADNPPKKPNQIIPAEKLPILCTRKASWASNAHKRPQTAVAPVSPLNLFPLRQSPQKIPTPPSDKMKTMPPSFLRTRYR